MSTSISIPKDPEYVPSMDWKLLRREGIRHIEKLGSAIWTDYNLHDPGVTILEILCYAITDLGYRANMPPADLFAEADGGSFYTAATILPCGPVSALDIRKVLIDIPGVQNAWVEQSDEAEVSFRLSAALDDTLARKMTAPYFALLGAQPDNFPAPPLDLTDIRAMFICQDEKSRDMARKTFRENLLAGINLDNTQYIKVLLLYMADNYFNESIDFLEEELIDPDSEIGKEAIRTLSAQLAILKRKQADENFNHDWTDPDLIDLLSVTANKKLADFFYRDPILCLLIAGSFRHTAASVAEGDYNLFIPQGIYSVSLRIDKDAEGQEPDILAEARRRLHGLRNIGEDFYHDIHIVEKIDMGIDLCLGIDAAYDTLDVMAAVYQAINNYLVPDIHHYSLEEMLNRYALFEIDEEVMIALREALLPPELLDALLPLLKQKYIGDADFKRAIASAWDETAVEDHYDQVFVHVKKYYDAAPVYNGPLLQHGFIEEKGLLNAQPRQTVYRSDLYQEIAAVEGVISIEKLEIFRCDQDDRRRGNWCISFPCRCLPELSFECSDICVVSNGVEISVDISKVREYLETHPRLSTKLNRQGMMDIPVPEGKVINDLTEFTSIQEDFPSTYKIGTTGIGKRETALRHAQAKQLKGYLFFYDQLLANYLSHLSGVKSLFAIEDADPSFFQTLYDIPGIKELLLDYRSAGDTPENTDDPAPGTDPWEQFRQDQNNPYISTLRQLAQGNDTEKKIFRNKVLDHLLGRFGEQFTDYILQLYRIEKPVTSRSSWDADEGLDEAIADKQRFLENIPALSSRRAQGFNYYSDEVTTSKYWKTDNTEMVRRRVCAILGIGDDKRHTITCEPSFFVDAGPMKSRGKLKGEQIRYEFFVKRSKDASGKLLVSKEKFRTPSEADKASRYFLDIAVNTNGYGIVNGSTVGFWVNIADDQRTTDNALLIEPEGDDADPVKRLAQLKDLAASECSDDGFHILEHLLLRPRNDAYTKLIDPMLCCSGNLDLLDPYSFWITVVVPAWSERFSDSGRYMAFEQTLRKEMPAHLAVRFCTLNREDMFAFEKAYYEWLKSLCSVKQDGLARKTDELVQLMNNWNEDLIHYF